MALRPPGGADFPLPGGVSAPLQNLHRARLLTLSARSTNPQILRRGLTPIQTSSNSMACPSLRLLRPARSTAEI